MSSSEPNTFRSYEQVNSLAACCTEVAVRMITEGM
jgi:hypothetical protein